MTIIFVPFSFFFMLFFFVCVCMSCVHTDYIRCKRVYAIYYYFFVLALQVPLWKTMPRTNRLSRSLHPLIPFSCVCVCVCARILEHKNKIKEANEHSIAHFYFRPFVANFIAVPSFIPI